MYSDRALLEAVQRERNPELVKLECEHEMAITRMQRESRREETPHEYVIRQIRERKFR